MRLTEKQKLEIWFQLRENAELITENDPENKSFPKFYFKIRESDLRLKVLDKI